ncbi:hypothetical protein A5745_12700 [Mycobacterium sp. IS-2888]|uniref:hypothetical protein n=1 Tax=Mycobacterium sp. IS-2888 TaxID=1834159 RepID=UPI00096E9D06|nr:hypothetical protein [Mycobacterium sp. IS-2888]OMC46344.1 hypothetical protein A5745_12700 [Mycobacterium sp. IS-2888]
MRDQYSFHYNDIEPKDEHGCCASMLTRRGHAYVMHRLSSGWWAASHQFQRGPVEIITPHGGVKSGHRAYQTARDHLTVLQGREKAAASPSSATTSA